METDFGQGTSKWKKESPKEEVPLEEFSFRPLTEGLGFHQESPSSPVVKAIKTGAVSSPKLAGPGPTIHRHDLGPFYDPAPKAAVAAPATLAGPQTQGPPLSKKEIFLAFGLDILVVGTVTLITLLPLLWISGWELAQVLKFFPLGEGLVYLISIFSVYYFLFVLVKGKLSS